MSELVGVSAGRLVRFAPLIAGRVPVMFAAGKLVSDAPEPLNVVAVRVPFDELNARLVPVFKY